MRLGELVDESAEVVVTPRLSAPFTVDCACFGVDAAGKLSDDRYMTFFNQPATPCGGVRWTGSSFVLRLAALPAAIDKLVFTAAIDGAGTMNGLAAGGSIGLAQAGGDRAVFRFSGGDFGAEKALIILEIYRREGGWRLTAQGQGFNGGLAALLRHFGGEVAEDAAPTPSAPAAPPPTSPPAPAVILTKAVRLEKELSRQAPKLVSLAKSAGVALERRGLGEHRAKVCLVLDVSGSMNGLYKRGVVQQIADRLLALACWLDDDRSVDVFLFDNRAIDAGPITLENFEGQIAALVTKHKLGGGTAYSPVMNLVRLFYGYGGERQGPAPAAELPVYVMFVTDGGCTDRPATEPTVRTAAFEPIFWQFVGVGGGRFEFLEKLDDLKGRFVDNADFGEIKDPSKLSDEEMYERLMKEYPDWVGKARDQGLLRRS